MMGDYASNKSPHNLQNSLQAAEVEAARKAEETQLISDRKLAAKNAIIDELRVAAAQSEVASPVLEMLSHLLDPADSAHQPFLSALADCSRHMQLNSSSLVMSNVYARLAAAATSLARRMQEQPGAHCLRRHIDDEVDAIALKIINMFQAKIAPCLPLIAYGVDSKDPKAVDTVINIREAWLYAYSLLSKLAPAK